MEKYHVLVSRICMLVNQAAPVLFRAVFLPIENIYVNLSNISSWTRGVLCVLRVLKSIPHVLCRKPKFQIFTIKLTVTLLLLRFVYTAFDYFFSTDYFLFFF